MLRIRESKGTLLVSLLALASMVISACVVAEPAPAPAPQETPSAPGPTAETVTLFVGPNSVPCMGVGPMMCLQVKDTPDGEYLLFYSNIEGFEFEPGFEYELLVNKETVPRPPADASSFRWTLIEVVSKTPVEPAAELEGVIWELIAQVGQNGILTMTTVEATMTLNDGEAGGRGGCNMYFAPYVLDGEQLTFGPAGSTMMACEEPAMAQEQTFLANLERSATYEIVADQLHIFDEAGEVILVFRLQAATPLTGTLWQATMVNNGQGAVVSVIAGTELTATFQEDGTVFGAGGCNNFSGGYTVDGDQINIGPLAMTMMFCAEPEGVMEQEMAYAAALESAATFSIQGDQLELRTADGALAVSFVAVELPSSEELPAEPELSLEGPTWQLVSFLDGEGNLAQAEVEATIKFEDGRVGGNASCNRFFASYTLQGDQLTISQAGSTMMACPEPAMSQEQAFLTNLGQVAAYSISGSELTLFDASGQALLVFEPQIATPLIGTLWQATSVNNGRGAVTSLVTGTEITATFDEDGTIFGTAGCNRYSGSFSVDGNQMSIMPLAMTMMMCPEPEGVMEQETAYVAALETVATYSIEGDRLELRTADGALAVSFVAAPEEAAPATRGPEGGIVGVTWEWVESLYSDDTSIQVVDPSSYTLLLQPNGAVALQVDCNRGGGTYTLDGSQLTLEVAVLTRVACPEGTLSNEFIRDLNNAASFVMDGEDLVISLFADAGVMRFRPGPVAAASLESISPELLTMSLEGVAESIAVQVVPATSYDASMPPGPTGAPEHLAVTFDGQSLDEASFEGRVLYIVPVADYVALWQDAGDPTIADSIALLEKVLAEQPVDPQSLPVLPPPPGVMDLAVQTAYLDIPGLDATGVRWVGRFSQDLSPIFNYQLRYLFQGLTADGQYLISASFPITTSLLPDNMDSMTEDETTAFNEDPQAFLEATATALSFLAPSDFNPDLAALDAMIESMGLETPEVTVGEPVTPTVTTPLVQTPSAAPTVSFSDLTGKAWQWVAFTDPVNGQQEIANASRYQIIFQPNGLARVQADCNRGAGQYSVDDAAININIQTMTRAMCPPGSLSNEFVQRLNAAAIWFVQDGDLFIDLFADSGTMRFALAE